MKVYHEIYPAEGWAEKISKYLKAVAEEKPNMYAKTKRRYENLATSLLESAALIASILEEDSLIPNSNDEFDELAGSGQKDLEAKLADVTRRFKKTEEFSNPIVVPPPHEKKSDTYEYNFYDTCKYYDTILKEATITNFGYSEVNECAKLLYMWFHTRFMPEVRDAEFVCQIRYLPSWITSFIIAYGRYLEQRKSHQFQKMLEKWCGKVESGEAGVYVMPYEIYRIDDEYKKGIQHPEDYTLHAVIINDILLSECLYKLGDSEYEGSIRYNQGDLANIVKDRNPALTREVVTRFAQRSKYIREIGLTPVGGNDVDE